MKISKKTGIAMGLLLLPVFLYLLFSIQGRPDTKVPNEYKKSLISYFPKGEVLFQENISLVFFLNKQNQNTALEKIVWFDQLFDNKFSCFQLLIYAEGHVFVEDDINLFGLSDHAKVLDGVAGNLFELLSSYEDEDCFILIDEEGELRGLYLLNDDKSSLTAKTELFILLKNASLCQKGS